MGHLKAIETTYRGHRYRSRLEARWAVFFTTLGIRFEYEKEGYKLGSAGLYLPDFWLPDQRCWVEIKGEPMADGEMAKQHALALHDEHYVFLFEGQIIVPSEETPPLSARVFLGESTGPYARPDSDGWRWQLCPVCRTYAILPCWAKDSPDWYCAECDEGPRRAELIALGEWMGYEWHEGEWTTTDIIMRPDLAPSLIGAYCAASEARFEFGENGAF